MSAKNKIKEMNDEKKRMLGEADKQTSKDTTNVRAEFRNLDKRSNLLRLASMMKPYAGKMLFCAFLVLMINLAELVEARSRRRLSSTVSPGRRRRTR